MIIDILIIIDNLQNIDNDMIIEISINFFDWYYR